MLSVVPGTQRGSYRPHDSMRGGKGEPRSRRKGFNGRAPTVSSPVIPNQCIHVLCSTAVWEPPGEVVCFSGECLLAFLTSSTISTVGLWGRHCVLLKTLVWHSWPECHCVTGWEDDAEIHGHSLSWGLGVMCKADESRICIYGLESWEWQTLRFRREMKRRKAWFLND